jgi:peptidoglycan/LPS O-acetylase OafA/YrhL
MSTESVYGLSMGYRPELDGLRALSVLAVIAYHADLAWIPGGFLGVEVFFVVSGFLITTLMLEERAQTGSVSLRSFWLRRARRLMPALFVMLVALAFAVATFHRACTRFPP